MERICPICQKIIKYDNIDDLEYDEKHGNSCGDCGVIDEHDDIREETDFSDRLEDGFDILNQVDRLQGNMMVDDIGILGVEYINLDDETRAIIERAIKNLSE